VKQIDDLLGGNSTRRHQRPRLSVLETLLEPLHRVRASPIRRHHTRKRCNAQSVFLDVNRGARLFSQSSCHRNKLSHEIDARGALCVVGWAQHDDVELASVREHVQPGAHVAARHRCTAGPQRNATSKQLAKAHLELRQKAHRESQLHFGDAQTTPQPHTTDRRG